MCANYSHFCFCLLSEPKSTILAQKTSLFVLELSSLEEDSVPVSIFCQQKEFGIFAKRTICKFYALNSSHFLSNLLPNDT